MIQEHGIPFFKSVDIFSDLTDEEMDQVMNLICTEKVPKNAFVFSENDPGRKLYIVKEGELTLELAGRTVRQYTKGEVFGEIALINGSIRSGSIKSVTDSVLFCLDGEGIFDNQKIPPETALKVFKELAIKVTSYLRPIELTTTRELINEGEGEHVEFKSTLRLNLFTKKFDKEIEHSILKTVAAFLNSEGGTLLIGVNDEGELLGLEADRFPNEDKMLLHFTHMVNERISMQHMSYVDCYIEPIENTRVMRVDVRPSNIPAYLEHGNEEKFYIRTGPSTSNLKISEHYDFVRNRFA